MPKLTILLFSILISFNSYGDFQDGLDAYNREDYKTAFNEWQLLANQGDASAQYNLGWMYANGEGVLKDPKEAVKWYTKAAEQGDADAQYKLGWMYSFGKGVHDLSKTKYWIKKAYENPEVSASTKESAEKHWNLFELWKY